MEVYTVYDEDDCEEAQTEIGESAESSVFRSDEHGSQDECNAAGGTGRTLQIKVSVGLYQCM